MINVLTQASEIARKKWRTAGRGWRIFLAVIIVILLVVGLVALCIWAIVKFLKALSIGSTRNLGLYYPARRR